MNLIYPLLFFFFDLVFFYKMAYTVVTSKKGNYVSKGGNHFKRLREQDRYIKLLEERVRRNENALREEQEQNNIYVDNLEKTFEERLATELHLKEKECEGIFQEDINEFYRKKEKFVSTLLLQCQDMEAQMIRLKRLVRVPKDLTKCVLCASSPPKVICSCCKWVAYCGPECQKKHWNAHKHVCVKLD